MTTACRHASRSLEKVDWNLSYIRHIDMATAVVTTVAGNGSWGFADGVGTVASFKAPAGIAIARNGSYALVVSAVPKRISLARDHRTRLHPPGNR